ncbi:MAG: hypothetical protein WCH34_10865 [Bacteroidota bacterium]
MKSSPILRVFCLILIGIHVFIGYSYAQNNRGNQSKYNESKAQKNKIAKGENQKDELGRKQGNWKYLNFNKVLVYEVTYLNDVRHGVSRRYHAGTGTQIEEANYFNGKLDGEYRSYFVAGQVKAEGSYLNGKKTGEWITYYSVNGEKKSEGYYINGLKQGEWRYYHSKGYMKCKGDFVNDMQEGTWVYYNEEAKVVEQKMFSRGYEIDANAPKSTKPADKNKKTVVPKK